MADVFISYTRDDFVWASRLAENIKNLGYSVWWDTRLVAGEDFYIEIRENLNNCSTVIVLWSEKSHESRWVQAEAHKAFSLEKLVCLMLDDIQVDVPFNILQHTRIEDLGLCSMRVRKDRLAEILQRSVGPPRFQIDFDAIIHFFAFDRQVASLNEASAVLSNIASFCAQWRGKGIHKGSGTCIAVQPFLYRSFDDLQDLIGVKPDKSIPNFFINLGELGDLKKTIELFEQVWSPCKKLRFSTDYIPEGRLSNASNMDVWDESNSITWDIAEAIGVVSR